MVHIQVQTNQCTANATHDNASMYPRYPSTLSMVCKTPLHLNTRPPQSSPYGRCQTNPLGSRTPHPHPLSHARLVRNRTRRSTFFYTIDGVLRRMTTHQRTFPAKAPLPGHRQATKTVSIVGRGVGGRENEEQQ
jgi:hypothetical protein